MKIDELDRRRIVSTKHEHADMVGRSPENRRFAPRRRGQMPAMVFFEGTAASMPCKIADMSTTGALLELREGWDHSISPDIEQVKLVLRYDRVMYLCRIIRRGEKDIGVKFTAPPRTFAKPPEPPRRTPAR